MFEYSTFGCLFSYHITIDVQLANRKLHLFQYLAIYSFIIFYKILMADLNLNFIQNEYVPMIYIILVFVSGYSVNVEKTTVMCRTSS